MRASARRHGVSPTAIQEWRERTTTADAPTGPKRPRSAVLSAEEEAVVVVAFRRHALPSPDDRLHGLQPTIPHLTRSGLHRRLERHGIGRLPEVDSGKPARKRFGDHPIVYLHVDTAEVGTAEGEPRLLVAIDRTSGPTFVRPVEGAGEMEAARFPREPIEAVPYRIRTVLTDDGIQFTSRERDTWDVGHVLDRVCAEPCGGAAAAPSGGSPRDGIEHRLTEVSHPWTNGQVERMNRTIKDATVKRYHHDSREQSRTHLQLFVDAHNHARRLETLRGLTPYEYVCQIRTKQPERFRLDPSHHVPGPYKPLGASTRGTGQTPVRAARHPGRRHEAQPGQGSRHRGDQGHPRREDGDLGSQA